MSKKPTILPSIGKGKTFQEVMESIINVNVKDLDYKKKKSKEKKK